MSAVNCRRPGQAVATTAGSAVAGGERCSRGEGAGDEAAQVESGGDDATEEMISLDVSSSSDRYTRKVCCVVCGAINIEGKIWSVSKVPGCVCVDVQVQKRLKLETGDHKGGCQCW